MSKLKKNPLKTKKDLIEALNTIIEPIENKYIGDYSGVQLSYTSALYGQEIANVETMLRLLWGLVPLEAGGTNHTQTSKILEGIINGTNPEHPNYWGKINHFDQLIVEMATLGYMMVLAPNDFWDPLTKEQQANIIRYVSQVNEVDTPDCNWLFFAVMVNIGLKKVGEDYNKELIERNLNRIEAYYIGDGLYSDGEDAHVDYYVAFAIHFYSLIYAVEMEKEDPERSRKYKERAKQYAHKFVYWFSEEGQGVPYGRSMTYRYAQVAFFSAYIYADVDPEAIGWMKGMILRHIRYWFKQPIFNGDGTLSVGYVYPNLHMSEDYNAPGSPYWSFKSFLILALPEDHLFWMSEEKDFPEVEAYHNEYRTEQTLVREDDHVIMFPNGYKHLDMHNHSGAKYEKFAYSTHFGFSVPRSNLTLGEGAFDSMLALSKDGLDYRVKRRVSNKQYFKDFQYMEWQPWEDVRIKTWIIPGAPMHVRIHNIQTRTPLSLSDGGFALGSQPSNTLKQSKPNHHTVSLQNENGLVGAIDLLEKSEMSVIKANSNTNLIHPNTVIPSIQEAIGPGEHLLVHAFYGSPHGDKEQDIAKVELTYLQESHTIRLNGKEITLNLKEQEQII